MAIDIDVPEDRNICEKEKEKISKYQDLRLEIMKIWNIKNSHSSGHRSPCIAYSYSEAPHEPGKIPGYHKVNTLTKAALRGNAHILRRVLDLPETKVRLGGQAYITG